MSLVFLPGEGIEHPVADRDVLLFQIDVIIDLRMTQIAHGAHAALGSITLRRMLPYGNIRSN